MLAPEELVDDRINRAGGELDALDVLVALVHCV